MRSQREIQQEETEDSDAPIDQAPGAAFIEIRHWSTKGITPCQQRIANLGGAAYHDRHKGDRRTG